MKHKHKKFLTAVATLGSIGFIGLFVYSSIAQHNKIENRPRDKPSTKKMLGCMEWSKEKWREKLEKLGYEVSVYDEYISADNKKRHISVHHTNGIVHYVKSVAQIDKKRRIRKIAAKGISQVAPGIKYYYNRMSKTARAKTWKPGGSIAQIPGTKYAISFPVAQYRIDRITDESDVISLNQ